jgi:adenylosuccinate lyase
MLDKTHWLIAGLQVNAERMRKNLELTLGLVFSGQLLLDLAAAGMLREEAYRIVQAHAMKAWAEDGNFRAAIESDTEITTRLDPPALAKSFSVSRQLANVDQIFDRVFHRD